MNTPIELVAWIALVVAAIAFVVAVTASRQQARIESIEQRLAQMPSAAEITNIRVKLASLEAKQDSVFNEAHGARSAIRRVEDFLLKAKRDHDSQF